MAVKDTQNKIICILNNMLCNSLFIDIEVEIDIYIELFNIINISLYYRTFCITFFILY